MSQEDHFSSTLRIGLESAPDGLCLIQELVNTASAAPSPWPDFLRDITSAQSWLDSALWLWASQTAREPPRLVVSGRDLPPLRDLRDQLRALLTDPTPAPRMATASIELGFDGGT